MHSLQMQICQEVKPPSGCLPPGKGTRGTLRCGSGRLSSSIVHSTLAGNSIAR